MRNSMIMTRCRVIIMQGTLTIVATAGLVQGVFECKPLATQCSTCVVVTFEITCSAPQARV